MARPEFSESQFVIGYLREYLNQFPFYPSGFWNDHSIKIPSTTEEVETGADFIFSSYSHSEFVQFKRSDFLCFKGKGYLNDDEKDLPKEFFDYYRFKVYNEDGSRQFEKLKEISTKNPNDRAYYVAPLFHTEEEFRERFSFQTLVDNSVRIDCAQFNEPQFNLPAFDPREKHKIVYNNRGQGYMLSKTVNLKIEKGVEIKEQLKTNSVFKSIIELNKILDTCTTDEIGMSKYYNQNEPINTFSFIYKFLLSNYNIHWIPQFNRPNSFQDIIRLTFNAF
jgi:hypothetical protein